MYTQKIIDQLDDIYGKGRGMGVYTRIMPGILADFDRMLKKAPIGEKVSEQYNLEDGKGIILVSGTKKANGQSEIDMDVIKS